MGSFLNIFCQGVVLHVNCMYVPSKLPVKLTSSLAVKNPSSPLASSWQERAKGQGYVVGGAGERCMGYAGDREAPLALAGCRKNSLPLLASCMFKKKFAYIAQREAAAPLCIPLFSFDQCIPCIPFFSVEPSFQCFLFWSSYYGFVFLVRTLLTVIFNFFCYIYIWLYMVALPVCVC